MCSDKHTLIKGGQHLSPATQIRKGELLPDHIHSKQIGKIPWNANGGVTYKANRTGYYKRKKEHRIVIERLIGRELHTWEIVHHVNKVKKDNRAENLWLFANTKSHLRHHKGLEYPKSDLLFKGGDVNCP